MFHSKNKSQRDRMKIFYLTIGGKNIPKLKLYSLRSSTKAMKIKIKIYLLKKIPFSYFEKLDVMLYKNLFQVFHLRSLLQDL